MGNVFQDITEEGNVWRDDALNLKEEAADFFADKFSPELIVAPMAGDKGSRSPRRRLHVKEVAGEVEPGQGRADPPSEAEASSATSTAKAEFSEATAHYFRQEAQEMLLEPDQVVAQLGSGDHRPTLHSVKRGWVPLDKCTVLQGRVLLTKERLIDLYPFLPLSVRFSECWKLIYCPRIHGVSLQTFYRQCQAWPGQSLMLIEDTRGVVFGGFSSSTWKVSRDKLSFGLPECFLFSYGLPEAGAELRVFPWAGGNRHFMYASLDGFGMGFDSGFALWIEKEFLRGESARSATFGNEAPIASASTFVIKHFECWAFDHETMGTSQAGRATAAGHTDPNRRTSWPSTLTSPDAARKVRTERLREEADEALRFEAFG